MKLAILIILMMIAVNISGILLGIEVGKRVVRNEAMALGYAERDPVNQSFRWLCDSPAVEGVGVVEGCRCFSEEVE